MSISLTEFTKKQILMEAKLVLRYCHLIIQIGNPSKNEPLNANRQRIKCSKLHDQFHSWHQILSYSNTIPTSTSTLIYGSVITYYFPGCEQYIRTVTHKNKRAGVFNSSFRCPSIVVIPAGGGNAK